MKQPVSRRTEYRQGLLDALPLTISLILFGGIFGMLSIQAGLTSWQSLAMSLIVFAGASQFTAISMIPEHTGIWAIILTTFLLNSRHLIMGLSMAPHYKDFSQKHVNVLAFLFVDEQYALSLNRFRQHKSDATYALAVGLSLYLSWAFGTWIGTIAGQWLPDPAALGLNFSFTAMFLALAYYQLQSVARIMAFLFCGAIAVWLGMILPNGLHLLAAGIVAFGIGYFLPQKQENTAREANSTQEVKSV